jgi:ribosomal protein L37AE/L43A
MNRTKFNAIVRKSHIQQGYECPDCGRRGGHEAGVDNLFRCRDCRSVWSSDDYALSNEESSALEDACRAA